MGGTEMTNEQQRKMLECATKACGPEYQYDELEQCWYKETDDDYFGNPEWNPLTNPADTAEMCAKLEIDWMNTQTSVICGDDSREYEEEAYLKSHDNSRLKAWMYAATMVAAKIGGHEDA
jgi:hypothetical protein